MPETKYLALLRGINVGGNNIIKMLDLKKCFEDMGLHHVITYIQSGNVIFTSSEKDISKLTILIENALSKTFNYQAKIVLISYEHLKEIVAQAPKDFGKNPDLYRYDFIFLKDPLQSEEALKTIRLKEEVDFAHAGKSVIYFSRLIEQASKSYMNKIILLPIYKSMTIRNWNSTTKLLSLMENMQ